MDPDPGDAVDVLQRGDEACDRFLPDGAAFDFHRRSRDRAAEATAAPAPSVAAHSADADAFSSVSQTSRGRTRASSRITRSQSKRLSARLVTVAKALFVQSLELGVGGQPLRLAPPRPRLRASSG